MSGVDTDEGRRESHPPFRCSYSNKDVPGPVPKYNWRRMSLADDLITSSRLVRAAVLGQSRRSCPMMAGNTAEVLLDP